MSREIMELMELQANMKTAFLKLVPESVAHHLAAEALHQAATSKMATAEHQRMYAKLNTREKG